MEARFQSFSNICALMPRPQLVHGLLITWLRNHFSAAAAIEEPKLQDAMWSLDIRETDIVIDSVYRWNPAQTESRPGIFLKRGPWKVMPLGIDSGRKMGITHPSGSEQYVVMTQGSHTLFCVTNAPAECEQLGAEVFRELIEFGPEFRKAFHFHRFGVVDVGEVSILEEASQHFVLPVTVAYAAEEHWETFQYAPPLKTIKLSTFLP